MDINRKIIENLRYSSVEEQKAILRLFDLTKQEPNTKLLLAIFRDSYIFRDMAQAMIFNQNIKINELERRIEKMELIIANATLPNDII